MTTERTFDCPNCDRVLKVRLYSRDYEAVIDRLAGQWQRTLICGCGEELQVLMEESA